MHDGHTLSLCASHSREHHQCHHADSVRALACLSGAQTAFDMCQYHARVILADSSRTIWHTQLSVLSQLSPVNALWLHHM